MVVGIFVIILSQFIEVESGAEGTVGSTTARSCSRQIGRRIDFLQLRELIEGQVVEANHVFIVSLRFLLARGSDRKSRLALVNELFL